MPMVNCTWEWDGEKWTQTSGPDGCPEPLPPRGGGTTTTTQCQSGGGTGGGGSGEE